MKKIKLIAMLLFIQCIAQGQSPKENLRKYWWYRYTLVNDFMTIGTNCGDDIIGYHSNTPASPNYAIVLGCAQAPYQLGHYMNVLATEYKMQKLAGLNTDRTLEEIYYAVSTAIRLDITGEAHCRDYNTTAESCDAAVNSIKQGDLNGFFIRDDIYVNYYNDHKAHYKQGHTCTTIDFVSGQGKDYDDANSFAQFQDEHNGLTWDQYNLANPIPETIIGAPTAPHYPEEESQDMLAFMYEGLALLTFCLDGSEQYNGMNLKQSAQDELERIVLWTGMAPVTAPIEPIDFTIKNPVTLFYSASNCGCPFGDHAYSYNSAFTVNWPYRRQCDKGGAYFTACAYPAIRGLDNINANSNYSNHSWYKSLSMLQSRPYYQLMKFTNNDEALWSTMYTCFSKTWTIGQLLNVSRKYIYKQSAKYYQTGTNLGFRWPDLPLLYYFLHGGNWLFNPHSNGISGIANYPYTYEKMLDIAPSCNPWNIPTIQNQYANEEWSAHDRLAGGSKRASPWPSGEFEGLDYMVLFNLYALDAGYLNNTNYFNFYYAKEFNYNFPSNGTGTVSNPYYGNFLEYLSSRSHINVNGNAVYRCGKAIELLPGFIAEKGSIFEAYIEDYECCDMKCETCKVKDNTFTMNNQVGEIITRYEPPYDSIPDYEPTEQEEVDDSLALLDEIKDLPNGVGLAYLESINEFKDQIKGAMKNGVESKKYNDLNNNISIYPNPSIDVFNIKSAILVTNVIVYDDLGNRVTCGFNTNTQQLSLQGNHAGHYTLQIITSKGSFFRKIILK